MSFQQSLATNRAFVLDPSGKVFDTFDMAHPRRAIAVQNQIGTIELKRTLALSTNGFGTQFPHWRRFCLDLVVVQAL